MLSSSESLKPGNASQRVNLIFKLITVRQPVTAASAPIKAFLGLELQVIQCRHFLHYNAVPIAYMQ